MRAQASLEELPEVWVGRSIDLAEGTVLRVEAHGLRVALARVEGAVHAVSDTCTHEEASLSEGFLDGHTLECPHHGALFDVRDGRALTLPAIDGVRTFSVRERGGEIYLVIQPGDAGGGRTEDR